MPGPLAQPLAKKIMSYFEDLTPYTYFPEENNNTILNIGWLSPSYEYKKGKVPKHIIQELKKLFENPVNLTRGFQICKFCQNSNFITYLKHVFMFKKIATQGNGEIRITHDGITYVAPRMIIHYIIKHGYCPPKEFLVAIENNR